MAKITRKEQKRVTREAVKKAALACFSTHGWVGTSIARVTRMAGVASGTFYVHFQSKEALIDELLDDFNAQLEAKLEPIWDEFELGAIETLLRRTAEVFLDHWQAGKGFVTSYVQRLTAGVTMDALRDGLNPPAVRFLSTRLQTVSAVLCVNPARVTLITQGLLAMWMRIGMQVLLNPTSTRDEAVEVLTRMTTGAFAAVIPPPDNQ